MNNKEKINEKLNIFYDTLNHYDWDGYGGEPISFEIVERAREVNHLIHLNFDADWLVAPAGDGSIIFEIEDLYNLDYIQIDCNQEEYGLLVEKDGLYNADDGFVTNDIYQIIEFLTIFKLLYDEKCS